MVEFHPVTLTARPARLAIMIPSGDFAEELHAPPWREMSLGAIAHLGRVWGGNGMVIVPTEHDGIARHILRLLSTYDPDFVVPYMTPGIGHDWISTAVRSELKEHLSAPDPYDTGDQPTLATAVGDPQYPLTPIEAFSSALGVPSNLTIDNDDDLQLLVASRVGWLHRADIEHYHQQGAQVDEESLDASKDYGLLSLAYAARAPRLGTDTGWRSTAFQDRLPFARTRHGCSELGRGITRRATTVVVGGTFEDFALSLLIDRTFGSGSGLWFPASYLTEESARSTEALTEIARIFSHDARNKYVKKLITSTSLDASELETVRQTLAGQLGDYGFYRGEKPSQNELEPRLPVEAMEVIAPIAVPLSTPVVRIDPLAVDIPTTVPFSGEVAVEESIPPVPQVAEDRPASDVRWHVDAMVDRVAFPPRRAMNGLVAEPQAWSQARAGRDGTTWMATTAWINPFELARVHHLSRHVLHEPNAYNTIESLLETTKWRGQPSNVAGFYYGTIDLWGGLTSLATDLMNPTTRHILEGFAGRLGSHGIVPGTSGRTVMRLSDVRKAADWSIDVAEARALLERLANRGILEKGFALKCVRCRNADFYRTDEVGQTFTCSRCTFASSPTGEAWPLATPGPSWFYRLDELVYQAVTQDVIGPVVALEHLRSSNGKKGMRWAVAIDMIDNDSSYTDLDFVALIGSDLIVGEAKTNGSMGDTRRECVQQLSKLREVAVAITADTVVLFTTTDDWNERSKSAAHEVFGTSWRPQLTMTAIDISLL